jgi:hypothetical protein
MITAAVMHSEFFQNVANKIRIIARQQWLRLEYIGENPGWI